MTLPAVLAVLDEIGLSITSRVFSIRPSSSKVDGSVIVIFFQLDERVALFELLYKLLHLRH